MSAARPILIALLLATFGTAGAADDPVSVGERIYREGVLPSGARLQALVRSDVPLAGTQVACVSCHRRSALGSSEGGFLVPPIAGPQLFAPRTSALHDSYTGKGGTTVERPAYDPGSLGRALRTGIDPGGRTLEPVMPRYDLGEDEVAALAAYLATFTETPDPGVTDTEIHFATLITPGASDAQREGLLQVLETFIRDKNAGTRLEQRRVANAPYHKRWQYGAYRHWVLHPWTLEGAPESWPAQLEKLYREQPVFAVVGGVGGGAWEPVHRFCEAQQLPCLLPHTPVPPQAADGDFYSVYLSRGAGLEAAALALYLGRQKPAPEPVVQVFRDTAEGRLAAESFRRGLEAAGLPPPVEHRLTAEDTLDPSFWQAVMSEEHPAALVAWLPAADLQALADTPPGDTRLFLSATTAPDFGRLSPGAWGERLYVVDPYRPLADRHTAPRLKAWARQRGIAITDLPLQADTYFAAAVTGDALAHIRGNFSRDYFLERIEHMTDNMLDKSVYARLTLAPGQRYMAKSCTVWQVSQGPESAVTVTP